MTQGVLGSAKLGFDLPHFALGLGEKIFRLAQLSEQNLQGTTLTGNFSLFLRELLPHPLENLGPLPRGHFLSGRAGTGRIGLPPG